MNLRALQTAWYVALAMGALTFVLCLALSGQFARPELVPIIISFALAVVVNTGIFFLATLVIAPGLNKFIASDETKIHGANVSLVTQTTDSGDAETDRWVKRFVFARNTFGMAIIPLALLGLVLWLG
jgi:hypothetical protein